MISTTEVELLRRKGCAVLVQPTWIDVRLVVENPLVGIGERYQSAVERELLHERPLRIVGVLKLVEDHDWVHFRDQLPNAQRVGEEGSSAVGEDGEGVSSLLKSQALHFYRPVAAVLGLGEPFRTREQDGWRLPVEETTVTPEDVHTEGVVRPHCDLSAFPRGEDVLTPQKHLSNGRPREAQEENLLAGF